MYSYEPQGKDPHAPYLSLKLMSPINNAININCKALLDTGADYTHVPLSLLKKIKVQPAGQEKIFRGFGGSKPSRPYIVGIELDRHTFNPLEVWGWNEKFVLVGRDILNQYCVELDGLNLIFAFKYDS
jgi:predicted aspartyl protease